MWVVVIDNRVDWTEDNRSVLRVQDEHSLEDPHIIPTDIVLVEVDE